MVVNVVGFPMDAEGGDAYGYSTAQKLMIRALQSVDISLSEDAHIYIHYSPPHFFIPREKKFNILFTMWESEDLPSDLAINCQKADLIIVPSKHSKEVFKRIGKISKTILVCNQAYDSQFYTYRTREWDGEMRFLWLGAPNERKGFELAVRAYHKAFFGTGRKTKLYLKSTLYGKTGILHDFSHFGAEVDTRNVTKDELRDIYYNHHILIYPSRGEGAGLIPMEAMATGTIVLAPAYSGMKDYMFSDISFPLSFWMRLVTYGCFTHVAECYEEYLVSLLLKLYEVGWDAIKEKAIKASLFVSDKFSIERMGRRMKSILETINEKI